MVVATERATHLPPPAPLLIELAELPSKNSRQIVRTEEGRLSERPAPDAFLGEKTRTVDRQSVKMGEEGAKAARAARTARPAQDIPQLRSLALPDFSRLANREPGPDAGESLEQREARAGAPGLKEYVRGVHPGESTALNTQEFVFYSFFERIRSQLDRAWEPILRQELIRIYKQGRRLASDQDHSTRVLVVLDAKGQVVAVRVQSESGVQILDEAAVRAFNRAGPFPNPPRDMLGSAGTVQIHWEFILKT